MKRGIITIMIMITILSFILSVIYFQHYDDDVMSNEYWELKRVYDLSINCNDDFSIIFPIAIDTKGPSNLMNDLHTNDNISQYTIVNSSFGYGMRVVGSGSCSIIGNI